MRATLTSENSTSPNSISTADTSFAALSSTSSCLSTRPSAVFGAAAYACISSSTSSRTFAHTASTSSHSNPAAAALRDIFCACLNAGKLLGTPSSSPSGLARPTLRARVGGFLLGELDLLPQPEDLVGVFRGRLAEHMGMPPDHLRVDVAAHVVDVELSRVRRYPALQHHLQKNVAELFAHMRDVVRLDGVDRLVGLLDHVLGYGLMRLLSIPRATVGGAQRLDGRDELLEIGMAHRRDFGHVLFPSCKRLSAPRRAAETPPFGSARQDDARVDLM